VQKHRELSAEVGQAAITRSNNCPWKSRGKVGHSSMAACPSVIAALVWSMIVSGRRKWTNVSFVLANAVLRFPVLRT